jgi:hypothetical protein
LGGSIHYYKKYTIASGDTMRDVGPKKVFNLSCAYDMRRTCTKRESME